MAEVAFEKYKPFILKRARIFNFVTRRKSSTDDFVQDVFINLYERLNNLDDNKVTENFTIYLHVYFATCTVFRQSNKIKICDDIENVIYEDVVLSNISIELSMIKFNNSLTKRKKAIIADRKNGIHESETLKKMKISHGTYNTEIKESKKLFNMYVC